VLTERIAGAGLPIERRAFLPHVTLLRDAKRAPPQVQVAPLVWQVGALHLVETIRREGKLAYRVRESWTLSR
jgi:2'-5' RNA ligase